VEDEGRVLDWKIFGDFSHHAMEVILNLALVRQEGDFIETFQLRIGSGVRKERGRHKRLLQDNPSRGAASACPVDWKMGFKLPEA
jgi:hypothetical protein